MNLRRTKTTRRALAAATIAAGLILSVTGCGGDGDKGEGSAAKSSAPAQQGSDGKAEPSAPATDKTLTEVKGNGMTLAITSATRDQGGFLNITGRVTNGTSKLWIGTDWKSEETELQGSSNSMAGASVVDQKGKKKYLVLRDTEGRCLCTKFEGGIDQGKSADWFAQFPAPPEGTKSVQLQVPTMPPAQLNLTEGE
ncbi:MULTISPECIES: hypothetical protein [unclassified Streptomyces]|uniref:hypothetical protein n=1 Tax=unclassified Streptomyces TaxID=2593676 RepID=UPI002E198DD4|nr:MULTISPECIES: hypothetical protein [unclassified Streptomyces]